MQILIIRHSLWLTNYVRSYIFYELKSSITPWIHFFSLCTLLTTGSWIFRLSLNQSICLGSLSQGLEQGMKTTKRTKLQQQHLQTKKKETKMARHLDIGHLQLSSGKSESYKTATSIESLSE